MSGIPCKIKRGGVNEWGIQIKKDGQLLKYGEMISEAHDSMCYSITNKKKRIKFAPANKTNSTT